MIKQFKFDHQVRITNLGDIHRGNPNFDKRFFLSVIDEIEKDPFHFWVSTGDLLEASTRHSIGDVHSAMSLQSEIELIADELAPIAGKCLGFVASNHHERVNKNTGLSLDKAVAAAVGLPFLGITGMINITVGKGAHYLVMHHGTGSGSPGNAVNRALKGAGIYKGADIYFSGHTHKMGVSPFKQKIIDRKRGIVRDIQSYLVITGHCLDWKNSYAENMALDPSPVGFAYVDIGPNENGKENCKSITPGFTIHQK